MRPIHLARMELNKRAATYILFHSFVESRDCYVFNNLRAGFKRAFFLSAADCIIYSLLRRTLIIFYDKSNPRLVVEEGVLCIFN